MLKNELNYIPASEIRPETMVKHIQALREKIRDMDAKEKQQEKEIRLLQSDLDYLKSKLRVSTL